VPRGGQEHGWNVVYSPGRSAPRLEISDELRRLTKLRTLEDMTEEEICALERHFGCPVRRPWLTKPPRKAQHKVRKVTRTRRRADDARYSVSA
jgi:hypothetical protein